MSTHDEADVRAEVRAWLAENFDAERPLIEWRRMLCDTGWAMPAWPSRWYGRDLPVGLVPVVDEEFERAGAPGVVRGGVRLLIV